MDLINADCLDALFFLDDNSVDSVVTDPPAGISFMGKGWDDNKGGRDQWIAWLTEVLAECHRVLKPGGHALVWSIPRTSHWTGMACENAGFEVRDQISHIFGSGFPKSHNVSKAIDKEAGVEREVLSYANRGMSNSTFSRAKQTEQGYRPDGDEYANEKHGGVITAPATDLAKQWDGWGSALKPSSEKWFLIKKKETEQQQMWYEVHEIGVNICQLLLNAFPANESLKLSLKELEQVLNTVPWNADASINTLADLCAQTDTLQSESGMTSSLNIASLWNNILKELLISASTFTTSMASSLTIDLRILKCLLLKSMQSSTLESENQNAGHVLNVESVERFLQNVAIKLSNIQITSVQSNAGNLKLNANMENVWLVRKPLQERTLASNVVKWGTGALNIDGCRIGTEERTNPAFGVKGWREKEGRADIYEAQPTQVQGRWPSHTLFDESAAQMLDEQSIAGGIHSAGSKRDKGLAKQTNDGALFGIGNHDGNGVRYGDNSIGASRFFYVPKASKSERNKGCEGLPGKPKYSEENPQPNRDKQKNYLIENHHPTVKPIKLMEYLIKLITPPGGIVLDPFAGSFSTGVAAATLGFDFIGIEKEKEYFDIGVKRLQHVQLSCDKPGKDKLSSNSHSHLDHSQNNEKEPHGEHV